MKTIFTPTKITNLEKALEVFHHEHKAKKLFGLKFRPSFRLNQDVFQELTQDVKFLRIPENTKVVLDGKGSSSVRVHISENAKLIAKKAEFLDVLNSGKKLIADTISGVLVSENKARSKVKTALHAHSKDQSRLKAKLVIINSTSGDATSSVRKVRTLNTTSERAKSYVLRIRGRNITSDNAFSLFGGANFNQTSNDAKSVGVVAFWGNNVSGKAKSYTIESQGGNIVKDSAHAFSVHIPNSVELKGDATCTAGIVNNNLFADKPENAKIFKLGGQKRPNRPTEKDAVKKMIPYPSQIFSEGRINEYQPAFLPKMTTTVKEGKYQDPLLKRVLAEQTPKEFGLVSEALSKELREPIIVRTKTPIAEELESKMTQRMNPNLVDRICDYFTDHAAKESLWN